MPGLKLASSIPIIDLQDDEKTIVENFRKACTDYGFMQIVGHPIPHEEMDGMMALAKRFFDLPLEEKRVAAMDGSKSIRGYTELLKHQLEAGTAPDLKEGFYFGKHVTLEDNPELASQYGHGPNRLPRKDVYPEFEGTMQSYFDKLLAFSKAVMQYVALSFGLDRHYFDSFCTDPIATLRIIHYPPTPVNADEKFRGAGAHTDYGALTFLMQDDVGGLQVWNYDKEQFIDVETLPYAFVVNVGDALARWSNDNYKSTIHRVINKSGSKDRYSIPFFLIGHHEAVLDCLPGQEGKGKKYAPMTLGENYSQKHNDAFARAGVTLK